MQYKCPSLIYLFPSWNEWVTLPIQYNDLPRTAQLALTVYDCVGPNKMSPVGGTTIPLFSKYGVFRQVRYYYYYLFITV